MLKNRKRYFWLDIFYEKHFFSVFLRVSSLRFLLSVCSFLSYRRKFDTWLQSISFSGVDKHRLHVNRLKLSRILVWVRSTDMLTEIPLNWKLNLKIRNIVVPPNYTHLHTPATCIQNIHLISINNQCGWWRFHHLKNTNKYWIFAENGKLKRIHISRITCLRNETH